MFRTYSEFFKRMFQVLDAAVVVLSFTIAWYIKFHSGWLNYAGHLAFTSYLPLILLMAPTFVALNSMFGLYQPMRARSLGRELWMLLRSTGVTLLLFLSTLYVLKLSEFSRDVLFVFVFVSTVLLVTERLIIRTLLHTMRRRGFNQRFILIVGWNRSIERFIAGLQQYEWFGYRVIGKLTDTLQDTQTESLSRVPRIGGIGDLLQILQTHMVDHVVIGLSNTDSDSIVTVVNDCESAGVQSLIVPDYLELLPARPRFETFGDMPLIDTRYVPLDDAMNAVIKRVFDLVFSLVVLVVMSPVMLVIALGIRLTSRGPVIYRQKRVGRNRRLFTMYKFRSMRGDVGDDDQGWTVPNDERRTKFGAFLRRASLDELAQFWNVLIGDMSVIGPRPERPVFVEQFKEDIPKYMVKHRVRPGITGWAQVNGWRGDTSIQERIKHDIDYIENWTFGMDMRIIVKTVRSGLGNKNAY